MDNSVIYNVIGRPVVTEKTSAQRDTENKIVFRVHKDANKIQIRQAIEQLFGVRVVNVNTMRMPSKPKRVGRTMGRRSGWKKAVVTLHAEDAIEFYATEADA